MIASNYSITEDTGRNFPPFNQNVDQDFNPQAPDHRFDRIDARIEPSGCLPPWKKSNSPSLTDVVSGESKRKEDKKGSTWKKSESDGLDSSKSTSIP